MSIFQPLPMPARYRRTSEGHAPGIFRPLPVPPHYGKTLKQRQLETNRTLALNSKAWQRLRASVLAEEPLCRLCTQRGDITPATEVDHVDNNPANNERENLQPLCRPCHSRKTRADYGAKVSQGCDVAGLTPEWRKSLAADGQELSAPPCFNADHEKP